MKTALVIPTHRPEGLDRFLAAWEPYRFWDDGLLIVAQDAEPERRVSHHHVSYADIEGDLEENAWIVSKGDSGRRCYGFLLAKRLGADLIVTLDDDCFPIPGRDYLAEHRAALDATPRWTDATPGLTPRGLPYRNRGVLADVMVNMGLWCGIPDQDASHQLVAPITGYTPPEGNRIMPAGQYFPLCGMSLAFKAEAVPLLYFPKQGEGVPYRRFDDIYAGIIARRVCDHLGWHVAAGRPWVEHRKASDPFTNLIKEAPGVALNETFWQVVDGTPIDSDPADGPEAAVASLGAGLARHSEPYIALVGRALGVWGRLCEVC